MNEKLGTIAVDLTPVLPGGANGGAKIVALELVRCLSDMVPTTQFILLTQALSHDELASMDRPNVRRLMVIDSTKKASWHLKVQKLASRTLPYLPGRARRTVGRLASMFLSSIKRSSSRSFLRDLKIDLLFCPFTAPTYFEPGIPTVCTVHDLQYKTYPEFFTVEDAAHRDRTFIEACRKATLLVAVSDYARDCAVKHGNLAAQRIRTIHTRIARRIAPQSNPGDEVLIRLGLTPKRYLVYPANFWRHKNHEMLLTAFGMACRELMSSDVKLVCTGAPDARQAWLKHAASTMNLERQILFPGYLPSAELAALMANCAGMVFPSLYEGFGLPVIEAMAARVPVACSNGTSLPEVAADAAIFFDAKVPQQIAKAIISLLEDDQLRTRLIEAGELRAQEFADTGRMAREYWHAFMQAQNAALQESLIAGVYADGWMGSRLSLQIADGIHAQTLEIEMHAPDWLSSPITVVTKQGVNAVCLPVKIKPGETSVVSIPLESSGGIYEICITPTFVPAMLGQGNDQRELSANLRRVEIRRQQGDRLELFPGKDSL